MQVRPVDPDRVPWKRRTKKQPSQKSPQKSKYRLSEVPFAATSDRQTAVQLQQILQQAVESQQHKSARQLKP